MSDAALWVIAGATVGVALVGSVAALFARRQILATHREAKVDRTVELHREATTGEVQAAKRRLDALLWVTGEQIARRRHVCYQPRLNEFHPAVAGVDRGGRLAKYGRGVPHPGHIRPLDDLHCIVHSFERLWAAQEKNVLDEDLLDYFAWDIARWSMSLDKIRRDDTLRVSGLHALRPAAWDKLTPGERERLGPANFVSTGEIRSTGLIDAIRRLLLP
jgi:hypothetical protein